MPLRPGAIAPQFSARSHNRDDFNSGSLGGMFVLLAFLPPPGPARTAAQRMIAERAALFDDVSRCVFAVVRDRDDFDRQKPAMPGRRWFHDPDDEIARAYAVTSPDGRTVPYWVLIDPMQRIVLSKPLAQAEAMFATIEAMGTAAHHAETPMHAPVLIVPRVFDRDLCRRLIEVYQKDGGGPSGVMRDIGGKTVGVLDDFKKRWDAYVTDEDLKQEIQVRIRAALLPQIHKAFNFHATRLERYVVARYDAKDGGYFRAHRDNTALATKHRQFACSINLNAEEFEGGDLRFAEFGRQTYRPPTGGAVIFSCSLLHEATPVTKGTRYAFLPFLYDDEHAKIRLESLSSLDRSAPAEAGKQPAEV